MGEINRDADVFSWMEQHDLVISVRAWKLPAGRLFHCTELSLQIEN
jgi:hypothetical protein